MSKLTKIVDEKFGKTLEKCSNEEIYGALLAMTKEEAQTKKNDESGKKLYYISAEFLIGKLLSNNLINLGMYDDVKRELEAAGKNMAEIEEVEMEPSLGNGGLGRLAACFLDSMATLGLNGDGIGLNYHYGLFKQLFADHKQKETTNPWITSECWLNDTGVTFTVPYNGFELKSKLFDIDVTGYESGTNKLHLFDVDAPSTEVGFDFDKTDIKNNLTMFLYPDDSDRAGQLLRIYQQYFMVSNGAQFILMEEEAKGHDLNKLYENVAIQINDTHPSMVIPELIRLLTEKGISADDAVEIVSKTCAYTNHTILAEALEKWPVDYLEEVVPQLMPIIRDLDARVKEKYTDTKLAIIDEQNRVHMATMDIHFGYSVNGVAALHTEILKKSELKAFYNIYPEKFNNKTNGITFRRWLMACNPELAEYITSLIGDGWKKDAMELEKLLQFKGQQDVRDGLIKIKHDKKITFAEYIKRTQNIDIDTHSIYDIQVKRLHEYKRQQMNALYAIYKYLDIKAGNKPDTPITMIFGAKAAPAYTIAKDIIHLILCLSDLIKNDPDVSPYLNVVMLENYNVTLAEKVIPACNLSEQISLASKEASGTGNMKFMLNGAVTLGTEDGANVEIHELVGDDNIFIFGKESDEIIKMYDEASYNSGAIYDADPDIAKLVDFIISPKLMRMGDTTNLSRLWKELINKDWFMTLIDVKEYIEIKEKAYEEYKDRNHWADMMLVNIAKAGYFSSDRTIEQYNQEIWKLR